MIRMDTSQEGRFRGRPGGPGDGTDGCKPVGKIYDLGVSAPAWRADEQGSESLLDAARQVFAERGFSGSGSIDAMRLPGWAAAGRNGCPVSKDQLFMALWQNHHTAHEEAVRKAVAETLRVGVTDPASLFDAGARAFLQGTWQRRDLALLFASGDAPKALGSRERSGRRAWLRCNAALLHLGDGPEDRLYAASLTSLIGRGGWEVATAGNFRQAGDVIDAVLRYARLLLADRPAPLPGT